MPRAKGSVKWQLYLTRGNKREASTAVAGGNRERHNVATRCKRDARMNNISADKHIIGEMNVLRKHKSWSESIGRTQTMNCEQEQDDTCCLGHVCIDKTSSSFVRSLVVLVKKSSHK